MDTTTTLMLAAGAAATIATGANAGDAISADEARAIVAEMLADAENRSSLLEGGHADSELKIGGTVQVRYLLNFTDDDGNTDDFDSGFDIPRSDLSFSGKIYDSIQYKLSFRADDSADLRDAWARWNWDNGWGLQLGQYKLPVWREDYTSSSRQLAVERSVVDDVFSPSRSQNIHIDYTNDNFQWFLAFSDGYDSDNTDYTDDSNTPAIPDRNGETDYAFTSRLNIKFAGDWKQFRDFTSAPGSETASALGVAIHWEGGELDESTGGGFANESYDLLAWVVDFSYEGDGWNLFAGYVGLYTDVDSLEDNTDHGFVVQGGFYIPDTDWERFARYDVVIPDGDRANDDAFNTLTFGTNRYLHGHNAKFTFDVVWYFDATTDNDLVEGFVAGNDTIGLRSTAEDDQVALRGQFQFKF